MDKTPLAGFRLATCWLLAFAPRRVVAAHEPPFAAMPPVRIAPMLTDRGSPIDATTVLAMPDGPDAKPSCCRDRYQS
ncbi:hypothetical protein D5047_12355 [Verminephrobacter eiseniae]|nr:hypothetical protein [Verminephrobacter eiseniae]